MDELIYGGFLKVVKRKINNIEREIVVQGEAAAIAVINEDNTKLLLVKQYRASVCANVWEIPAGMLDIPGESLETCVVRELEEEAHIKVREKDISFEIKYVPNIGTSTHQVTIFKTVVDETAETGVIEDDNDVVESRWFGVCELRQMIRMGKIIDGKTLLIFFKIFGDE